MMTAKKVTTVKMYVKALCRLFQESHEEGGRGHFSTPENWEHVSNVLHAYRNELVQEWRCCCLCGHRTMSKKKVSIIELRQARLISDDLNTLDEFIYYGCSDDEARRST